MNGIFTFGLLSRSPAQQDSLWWSSFYKISPDSADATARPQMCSFIKQLVKKKIIKGRNQLSSNPFRKDKLISCKGASDDDIHMMCSMKGQPKRIKVWCKRIWEVLVWDRYPNLCLKTSNLESWLMKSIAVIVSYCVSSSTLCRYSKYLKRYRRADFTFMKFHLKTSFGVFAIDVGVTPNGICIHHSSWINCQSGATTLSSHTDALLRSRLKFIMHPFIYSGSGNWGARNVSRGVVLLNKPHQGYHCVQVWILVEHSSEHYECIPPFLCFFFLFFYLAKLPLMQQDLWASCYRQRGSDEGESAIQIKWLNSLGCYTLSTWRRHPDLFWFQSINL